MKYEQQIADLKNTLSSAKNVLVVLPSQITHDKLAAGLALYLTLIASGKEVSIVTDDTPKVSHSNLYGVGQLSNSLPKTSGGNLTLTLEGVVASDGTVPALEKLDWYPEGANLNLVFHVLPGQTFQPARIIPNMSGGSFNLIFSIGASSLNALGKIYEENSQVFSGVSVINIDNEASNTQFGAVNIVDSEVSSVSEMVAQVLLGLGLQMDQDTSSNLLAGVYAATNNLTSNAKPETFSLVGTLVSLGGRLPQGEGGLPQGSAPQAAPQIPQPQQPVSQPEPQAPVYSQPVSEPVIQPQAAPSFAPAPTAENWSANFAPLNQVFGFPVQPETIQTPVSSSDNFTVPTIVNDPNQNQAPSAEERPMGEYVGSSNPEIPSNPDPDWLTPKVYKGVG
jgi:hypothetical protein